MSITVTRNVLQNAVEVAIAKADPKAEVHPILIAKLRLLAECEPCFGVGSYELCPLTMTGITNDSGEVITPLLTADRWGANPFADKFVMVFDDYMKVRVTGDTADPYGLLVLDVVG